MKVYGKTENQLILKESRGPKILMWAIILFAGAIKAIFFPSSNSVETAITWGIGVLGLAQIVLSSSISIVIDKTKGTIDFEKSKLVGGSSATYAIADVDRVELRHQLRNIRNSTNRSAVERPEVILISAVVFRDGSEMSLGRITNGFDVSVRSVVVSSIGVQESVANQVAKFIGVPLQVVQLPTNRM